MEEEPHPVPRMKNMTSGHSNLIQIRRAVINDLDVVKEIADKQRTEFGFVLRPSLEKSIINHEMFVASNNQKIIGFVDYHLRKDSQVTLYHIAVMKDYQHMGIGSCLLDSLYSEAIGAGKEFILLKCPTDLKANSFYEVYGFSLIQTIDGRKRPLNVWRFSVKSTMK